MTYTEASETVTVAANPGDGKGKIIVRGARQHNLQNVDVELPRNSLVVFTGPSGSGKSSLAFDTIYAEGQRRYVESLSAYARQFLERMDKPDVDFISGLAPAIAIEQKTVSRNPRSTVATQTEIFDHMRLLYARIGVTYSPISNEPVTKDSPRSVARTIQDQLDDGARFYVAFPLADHKKRPASAQLRALKSRGFFRILVLPTEKQAAKGKVEEVVDLNETLPDSIRVARPRILVLVDRLSNKKGDESAQSRLADSVEQAFQEGLGRCVVVEKDGPSHHFSQFFERDGLRFLEPTPHLFSFNSPLGACPVCEGFGSVPGLDPNLIIPDPDMSIRAGAIAPFRSDQWSKHFRELIRVAAEEKIDIDAPWSSLKKKDLDIVWNGKDGYIGIAGFFKYLESRSYKMHYRIFVARYRGYTKCPSCDGSRLREDALYVRVGGEHIGSVCELTIGDAYEFFSNLELSEHDAVIADRVLEEIVKRLKYLVEVGLDYLTLDRLAHTLSGGESQRINLATSLGSSLVGSLYVLDEPSIGLHPRDSGRLISILENLRDIGNTVLVVEHDAETIQRADHVVDLGPGAGIRGGNIIFSGTPDEILASKESLTGAYLSGRKEIPVPDDRRPIDPEAVITVENAREHNLKRLTVGFPLNAIVCVTGVSGSGKSTLVNTTLYRGLRRVKGQHDDTQSVGAHSAIRGHRRIDQVELVDQSPIGKTPRSNPISYIKAYSNIRDLFAGTHQAKVRGYRPGYFSFNVPGGRCETCQGEGVVKIEMQFLADLYLECEDCKGTRFKKEALSIRYNNKNIDDVLNMTVDEAVEFFADSRSISNKLTVLQDIGMGYLKLGQPSNTLSGGEAQRVKLAANLAKTVRQHTLYIFDEPTTGLHFDDIKKLLGSFQQLVENGHSVIIIEHNIDVIKSADWVIDMGPEGGRRGGFVVAEGPPEYIATVEKSHTGRFLKDVLPVT